MPRPAPMPSRAPRQEVTILMGLFDGARFLRAQLDSIAAQEGVAWRLLASDDGSTDATRAILAGFAADHPDRRIVLIEGPGRGPAPNFLRLIRAADPDSALAALSDQDDVWLPGKLARAAAALAGVPDDLPAIHCGRTILCDARLRPIGLSPLFRLPPSFRNALVQNIAGGNTMVLNRAALRLAQAAAAEAGEVVMHDWWLYQLVTGAGGLVLYDPEPMVLYRQHGANVIGANASTAARLRRARMVAGGLLRRWNETNVAALSASAHRLTPENRALLAAFAEAKRAPLRARLAGLARLGLYRQTRGGRLGYWAAAAAGLI
ncbi:MAG: glycosyltransferase [Rhodobacteraceae bacterium]|nr:glycosyltransferase [Paracoccaceae bacterium]